jgi:hypothetical protein
MRALIGTIAASLVVLSSPAAASDPPGVSKVSITKDGVEVAVTEALLAAFLGGLPPNPLSPSIEFVLDETEWDLLIFVKGGDVVFSNPSQSQSFNLHGVLSYWDGAFTITQKSTPNGVIGFSRYVDDWTLGGQVWHRRFPSGHSHGLADPFDFEGRIAGRLATYDVANRWSGSIGPKGVNHNAHHDEYNATWSQTATAITSDPFHGNQYDITSWNARITGKHFSTPLPEPGLVSLVGIGLLLLGACHRRLRKPRGTGR